MDKYKRVTVRSGAHKMNLQDMFIGGVYCVFFARRLKDMSEL